MSRTDQRSQRRAAVISLHFTYAHSTHMIGLAQLLRSIGFAVTFILAEEYLSSPRFSQIGDVIEASGFHLDLECSPIDVAVFCNSAVKNHTLGSTLRAYKSSIFYLFHEPESIWNWQVLKSEGALKMLRFVVSTYYSIKILRQSSGVIVCSSCAKSLYMKSYLRINPNVHVIPLPFEDEVGEERFEQMRSRKRYFGFVGTACKAHGFDAFVEFAKYALRNGSGIPFVIATGVDLSTLLKSDQELSGLVQQGKICLQHGRRLSNDEINQYYLECFCIWNVYRRSTQSGVLPRSFMTGTPVLASRIGSFPEDVFPGLTGEFVDANEEPAAILAIVEHMHEHATDYFGECRKRFLEKFHYAANRLRLIDILKSVSISVLPSATTTNR